MQDLIKNTICDNLVNYSNVSTSAINSIDYVPTESHESLSFLMKNNVLISFSIAQQQSFENFQTEIDTEE